MDGIWWYIGAATAIGGVQLVIGIAIGLWMRRDDRDRAPSQTHEAARAKQFAKDLHALTQNVTREVDQHHSKITSITSRLESAKKSNGDSLTDLVVGVVGELTRSNLDLQAKLTTATAELERQSFEIEDHLSNSLTDELTGLPNRRAFDDMLRHLVAEWRRRREPFAFVLLDIDQFKRVNDAHGHVAGDAVLRTFGEAVRRALRKPDFVARFGGEEFAVLLPQTTIDDAVHAARKVLNAVEAMVVDFDGASIRVTTSAGLASIIEREEPIELIRRADDALYASKNAGRNRAFMHDGARCAPIARSSSDHRDAGGSRRPSIQAAELSPELESICADLRDRASQLASEACVGASHSGERE